jgi:hypothetical protein
MPSFTSQVPNLQAVGPIVEIKIAVGGALESALRAAGKQVPTPISAVGLIDTGATGSVLQQGLAARLGLNPVGVTLINTPSSANVPCHEFIVRLMFPSNVIFETTAIEAPLQGQPIQCLIGRDVLSQSVLTYVGYMNQFTLSV